MDHLLSLSQAARMVGVTRKIMQQHVQQGRVEVFEGSIRMSELRKAFPEIDSDRSGMVEKVQRIKAAAAHKELRTSVKDPERLAAELHRARLEIAQLQDKVDSYRQLAAATEARIQAIQEHCDQRQAGLLQTFLGWYMNQNKLRT